MKFRKKPIIIDAEQWNGQEIDGLKIRANGSYGYIETLEGGHIVDKGDWVITGIKGEKYPCKPDIFEETYEIV
jgi:hypothetical protein